MIGAILRGLTSPVGAVLALAGVGALAAVCAFQLVSLIEVRRDLRATAAERDGVISWAEAACDIAGAPFKAADRRLSGADCKAAIRALVKFKTDTLVATNGIMADRIMKDLETAQADAVTARAQRDKALAANERLRRARQDEVTPDSVGPGYYRGLNDSAGLRAHDPAETGTGEGGGGGGDPAGGSS